jgi:hypothetical protein
MRRTVHTDRDASIIAEVKRRGLLLLDRRERWCPHAPTKKQAQFLAVKGREALYGGAAGGGKSDALLMAALQHVDRPNYAALILRRSYKDLALPGAIMDRSHTWLRGTAARWNDHDHAWTFPSGARLTFGYLETEKDKYRYQSSEFQFIAFDELTQFPETQYRYLFSRLRRGADSTIPLRMRAASNPGGIGHDWVFERFVKADARGDRVFVPATLDDNPHVDAIEYRKNLAELDETTRNQLEKGIWTRDRGGLIYRFSEANIIKELPRKKDDAGWSRVLSMDYGSSQVVPSTAFTVWYYHRNLRAAYLVESRAYAGLTTSTIAEHVRALEKVHGNFTKRVGDQGGLGSGYNNELRLRDGIYVHNVEKKDKLGFRKLFRGALEGTPTDGPAILVLDDGSGCNDAWIDEANVLSWNEKGTDAMDGQPDHVTDAGLYGWRECRAYTGQAARSQVQPKPRDYKAMRTSDPNRWRSI